MEEHLETKFYEKYWEKKLSNNKYNIRELSLLRWPTISYLLEKYLNLANKDIDLVDLGAGDGSTLDLLRRNYSIIGKGIEISELASEKARQRGFEIVTQSIEFPLPFPNDSIDVIICSEVLEHLRYPQKALMNVKNVLKNEGLLFLSVPNLGFIRNRIRLLKGMNPFDGNEYHLSVHLHHWTFRGLRQFLLDHSFRVIQFKGIISESFRAKFIPIRPSLFSDYIFCVAEVIKSTQPII